MNKRLLKEVRALLFQQAQKPLLENDYLIYMDDADTNVIHTIIKAPQDSVYRHKFLRLDFMIPDNYPHSPPEVKFINYDGVRIHPNCYENGKCCATILNTWGDDKYERWTSSMGIETVLLTFHSFLDNNPYTYEPGGRDDESYTVYVEFQSWITCLIRYLQHEKIDLFKNFINNYLLVNIDSVFEDLFALNEKYPENYYYTRCFEIDNFYIDYQKIMATLQDFYTYIDFVENHTNNQDITFEDFFNTEYNCYICFDTDETQETKVDLDCKHLFHKNCLMHHVEKNNSICPMCRRELGQRVLDQIQTRKRDADSEWMINPLTKRRIKIGGKTYMNLVNTGVLTDVDADANLR